MKSHSNSEIFGISKSLAKDQFTLYKGTKSTIITKDMLCSNLEFKHSKSCCVIELSLYFHKKFPTCVKSFYDLSKFIYDDIMYTASPFNICDIITDRYFTGS